MIGVAELIDGRYRVAGVLGQGGMSDVYEAVDEHDRSTVAIKVVRSGDPGLARRMVQEARALRRLRHPGLIRLIDSGVVGGQAYLVMELGRGATLAEVVRTGPLTPKQVATVGAGLADALAYVHGQGIVHRDVKPSNILVGRDFSARLLDFGIARLLDGSSATLTGTTLGTAAYMAPEQIEHHQVGPSADIWSLGIVLLECLYGRRVYEGTASEVVARRLAGPVPLPPDLPVPWKLLLSGMLDHRPDQRLDGAEVSALLGTAAFWTPWDHSSGRIGDGGEGVAATVPLDLTDLATGPDPTRVLAAADTEVAPWTTPVRSRRSPDRRRRIAAVAAIAVVAALIALALGLTASPKPARHAPPSVAATTLPSSTTRPSSTTAATTVPPTTAPVGPPGATQALATLVQDLASGVDAGTIQPGAAQPISTQAQQAVTDAAAGNASQAATDLHQAAQAISDGVKSHQITHPEGDQLQGALADLGTVLGVKGPAGNPEQ